MTEISNFVGSVPGFYRSSAVEQLLVLAWYLEARQGRSSFDAAQMRQSFRDAGLEPPDMSTYLQRQAAKKPPQLIKERGGYRLTALARRGFDKKFGSDATVVAVTKALSDLPSAIPDLAEREFLSEALNCYRVCAYRATIIMTWNLAYDHLVRWVFGDPTRIAMINEGIVKKYPKKTVTFKNIEDADELKESELIEAARTGKLLDKNTTQILKEKLARRNMAAHPSRVKITQHSADDMITDLVANVILTLV